MKRLLLIAPPVAAASDSAAATKAGATFHQIGAQTPAPLSGESDRSKQ